MVACACNASSQELVGGEYYGQGQTRPHSKVGDSLRYMKLFFLIINK